MTTLLQNAPGDQQARRVDRQTGGSTEACGVRRGAAPLGKLLRPSLGFTALAAHSGTPAASYCGCPSGQQRAAKLGRGRPTWEHHASQAPSP